MTDTKRISLLWLKKDLAKYQMHPLNSHHSSYSFFTVVVKLLLILPGRFTVLPVHQNISNILYTGRRVQRTSWELQAEKIINFATHIV